MATRCRECHAAIDAPTALDRPSNWALTMKCDYCGLEQPVPDLAERRRLLLEEQREQRLRDEAAAREAREREKHEREREQDAREQRDKQRARRRRWLFAPFTLIPLLVGPAIIAVTVFDAPARLGCGASGGDRLEQLQTQLAKQGCTVLRPIESEYVDGNLSKLVEVADDQCIRVIAAGGSGHRSLSISLYASWSVPAVAKVKDTLEPQLVYCAANADTMRYEIAPGPASKGRLSHAVLACPPAAPKAKSR